MKTDPHIANLLIELWRRDQIISNHELVEYLHKTIGYIPFKLKGKAFLAAFAPLASDCLWAGDILGAFELLTENGISKKQQRRVIKPKPVDVRGGYSAYSFSGSWSKSNWKTVK